MDTDELSFGSPRDINLVETADLFENGDDALLELLVLVARDAQLAEVDAHALVVVHAHSEPLLAVVVVVVVDVIRLRLFHHRALGEHVA